MKHQGWMMAVMLLSVNVSAGAQNVPPTTSSKPHKVLLVPANKSLTSNHQPLTSANDIKPNWEAEQLQKAKTAASNERQLTSKADEARPTWEAEQLKKAQGALQSDEERVLKEAKAAATQSSTLTPVLKPTP